MTVSSKDAPDLKEVNGALLKEPRFLPAWLLLLQLYAKQGQWKYVNVGISKATENVALLQKRTGLSFQSIEAELHCVKAQALTGEGQKKEVIEKEYRDALEKRSSFAPAKLGLAQLWIKDKPEESLKLLDGLDVASPDLKNSEKKNIILMECECLLQLDKADKAVSILEKAEQEFMSDAQLHLLLGKAYWSKGGSFRSDKKYAQRQFMLAAKCDPGRAESFYYLAKFFDEVAHDSDRAKRSHMKAFALDNTLVESAMFVSDAMMREEKAVDPLALARLHVNVLSSNPNCVWAAKRLGQYFLDVNNAENALSCFQVAVRAAPKDPMCWEGLGDSYLEQGKYIASLQAYKKAIEADEERNSFLPYFKAGSVLRKIGSSEEAIVYLEQANTQRPEYAPILMELALAWKDRVSGMVKFGLFDSARNGLSVAQDIAEKLSRLCKSDKTLVDVCLARAKLMSFNSKERQALLVEARSRIEHSGDAEDLVVCDFLSGKDSIDIDRVTKHIETCAGDSRKIDALLTLSCALCHQGNLSLAHHFLHQAVLLDPRLSKPYVLFGYLYFLGGYYALSVKSFAKAVSIEPDLPEAWTGEALIKEFQGKQKEARMLYASVAQLRADVFEANLGYGQTALACGNGLEAELGIKRALARDPNNLDALYLLSCAFEKQGRHDSAEQLLRKVLDALSNASSDGTKEHAAAHVVFRQEDSFSNAKKKRIALSALARILVKSQRWNDALDTLKSLSQPVSHQELSLMGYAAMKAGDGDLCIKSYEAVCGMVSEDQKRKALQQLAKGAVACGRTETAINVARKLLDSRPSILAAIGLRTKSAELLEEALSKGNWEEYVATMYSWRARGHQMQGRLEEAFADMQRAIREDPGRQESWSALAELSVDRPGLFRLAKIAEGQSSGVFFSMVGKADGMDSERLLDHARKFFQRRVFLNPENVSAWRSLGWAEFSYACLTNSPDSWRACLDLFGSLENSGTEEACAISECHLQLAQLAEAEAILKDVGPDHALVQRALARISLYKGSSKKDALQHYAKAVKLDPSYEIAWIEMSEIFVNARNFAAAEKCLRAVPNPTNQTNLRLLNVLLLARNEEAAKVVIKELPTVPRDAFAGNLMVGLASLKFNAMKSATRRLERAVLSDHSSPMVHELLAQCAIKQKDRETAMKEIEQEMQWGSEATALKMWLRLEPGNKKIIQKLIRLDPGSAVLWKDLEK